jgi:hypothetical protein
MTDGAKAENTPSRGFWDELVMLLLGAILGTILKIFLQPLSQEFIWAFFVLSMMAWLILQFNRHFKEKPIRSVRFWGISLTVGLLIGAVFATYAYSCRCRKNRAASDITGTVPVISQNLAEPGSTQLWKRCRLA